MEKIWFGKKEVPDSVDRITAVSKEVGELRGDIAINYGNIEDLKAQLQCAAKGHEMVYKERGKCQWGMYGNNRRCVRIYNGKGEDCFVFKCSACGLEITKTEAELTVVERDALVKLKLLIKEK